MLAPPIVQRAIRLEPRSGVPDDLGEIAGKMVTHMFGSGLIHEPHFQIGFGSEPRGLEPCGNVAIRRTPKGDGVGLVLSSSRDPQ